MQHNIRIGLHNCSPAITAPEVQLHERRDLTKPLRTTLFSASKDPDMILNAPELQTMLFHPPSHAKRYRHISLPQPRVLSHSTEQR